MENKDRIVYVKPLSRQTPLYMSRVNGLGSTLISPSRPDEHGAYFATRWVTIFYFPVIPLRRYYMTGSLRSGKLLGQAPLDVSDVVRTYATAVFIVGFIVIPVALLGIFEGGGWMFIWLVVALVLVVVLGRMRRARWLPRYVARWSESDHSEPQPLL